MAAWDLLWFSVGKDLVAVPVELIKCSKPGLCLCVCDWCDRMTPPIQHQYNHWKRYFIGLKIHKIDEWNLSVLWTGCCSWYNLTGCTRHDYRHVNQNRVLYSSFGTEPNNTRETSHKAWNTAAENPSWKINLIQGDPWWVQSSIPKDYPKTDHPWELPW